MPLYAGHGVGAVRAVRPAAEIVHELADGARALLDRHATPAPSAGADIPERIEAALPLDPGAAPPPIIVTPVAGIDREPGHAAKYQIVEVDSAT